MQKTNSTLCGSLNFSQYLCHVCKGEVGVGISLVLLDDFQELALPLQSHFEPRILTIIVVQGEGQDESLCIGVVLI